jgi:hypothetical protein
VSGERGGSWGVNWGLTGHSCRDYRTMHHGWMGARAKLGEEENLREYTRG